MGSAGGQRGVCKKCARRAQRTGAEDAGKCKGSAKRVQKSGEEGARGPGTRRKWHGGSRWGRRRDGVPGVPPPGQRHLAPGAPRSPLRARVTLGARRPGQGFPRPRCPGGGTSLSPARQGFPQGFPPFPRRAPAECRELRSPSAAGRGRDGRGAPRSPGLLPPSCAIRSGGRSPGAFSGGGSAVQGCQKGWRSGAEPPSEVLAEAVGHPLCHRSSFLSRVWCTESIEQSCAAGRA